MKKKSCKEHVTWKIKARNLLQLKTVLVVNVFNSKTLINPCMPIKCSGLPVQCTVHSLYFIAADRKGHKHWRKWVIWRLRPMSLKAINILLCPTNVCLRANFCALILFWDSWKRVQNWGVAYSYSFITLSRKMATVMALWIFPEGRHLNWLYFFLWLFFFFSSIFYLFFLCGVSVWNL